MNYNFEWDSKKAKLNERKHGISFERATGIFNDPFALTIFDEDHSEEEERWITMGIDFSGSLILACHTYKEKSKSEAYIRLYSARKATKKEKKEYERR